MNPRIAAASVVLSLVASPAFAKEPRAVDPNTGVYIETDASVIIVDELDVEETEEIDPDAPHVLFGGRSNHRGGWGGIETAVTSINGSAATLFGFRGGFMTGHRFTIGFAGAGIATPVEADRGLFKSTSRVAADAGSGHYIEGGYAGLLLQWEPMPRWVIHPHVSATLGAGAATYSQRYDEDGWDSAWDVNGDIETDEERPATVFSVADLRAGGTLNMTRWARLDAYLGYRHIGSMTDMDGLTRAELGGFSLGLGLRFGAF